MDQDVQNTFNRFDADHNGFIDETEFAQVLRALGAAISDDEAYTAFQAIDINGNGRIDFGEFDSWWQSRTT